MVRRTLRFANSVLDVLAFRVAWTALGAVVGLYVFVGLCLLFPGLSRWLSEHEFDVGARDTLPLVALAWLTFATAGAAVFTRGWSLSRAWVAHRLNAEGAR